MQAQVKDQAQVVKVVKYESVVIVPINSMAEVIVEVALHIIK